MWYPLQSKQSRVHAPEQASLTCSGGEKKKPPQWESFPFPLLPLLKQNWYFSKGWEDWPFSSQAEGADVCLLSPSSSSHAEKKGEGPRKKWNYNFSNAWRLKHPASQRSLATQTGQSPCIACRTLSLGIRRSDYRDLEFFKSSFSLWGTNLGVKAEAASLSFKRKITHRVAALLHRNWRDSSLDRIRSFKSQLTSSQASWLWSWGLDPANVWLAGHSRLVSWKKQTRRLRMLHRLRPPCPDSG